MSLIINLFSAWLFTVSSTNFNQMPIGWVLQNRVTISLLGIIILLLFVIAYLGSHLPFGPSERVIQKRYLHRLILETETLTLKGIPANLITEGVPLDEVFIPLQFRANRPLVDFPLTKSELESYRNRSNMNLTNEEIERLEFLLFEYEKSWYHNFNEDNRISLVDLWAQLTFDRPAAVLQGFPGMGKSTLLARLTLHMARRIMRKSDRYMPKHLDPPLIPLFLSLGDYANHLIHNPKLSLWAYIELVLGRLGIPRLDLLIQKRLQDGRCFVLLDGLDEVSSQQIRLQVQDAIKNLILEQRSTSPENSNFNRFLITSRVAGYDQMAFPEYPHYTIAELTTEQIEGFLPRWCYAIVRLDPVLAFMGRDKQKQREAIDREAKRIVDELDSAIKNQRGVSDLAENPLLLTLLVVVQQNGVKLPQRRIELYRDTTRMLLENRNTLRKLPSIPESKAIRYLGPLAFQMQESGNSFVRRGEVVRSLEAIVHIESQLLSELDVKYEVEGFLDLLRERGGLFVIRAGDHFGFFHRTFQEYFAARYLLNQIEHDPDGEIPKLIDKARRADDLWREPFLLAVAYESDVNEAITRRIISELLIMPEKAENVNHIHNVLLAAECLMETKPSSLGVTLEKLIAESLFKIYNEAQEHQKFETCANVETILQRWFLSISQDSYRPALLSALCEAIVNSQQKAYQRTTLILLAMVVLQLSEYPSTFEEMLIPPLLMLAQLPAVGNYHPQPPLSAIDMTVTDLAVTVLSFMGKQGPAGLLLPKIRSHFDIVEHSEHLRELANYSQANNSLLTFVVPPLAEENYQSYETAVKQWIVVKNRNKNADMTESLLEHGLDIHQKLLRYGEEVCYPSCIHLLAMLERTENPDVENWKRYLQIQFKSGIYARYREAILLWTTLFLDEQSQAELASIIIADYYNDESQVQQYAQHVIATMSSALRITRFFRYRQNLREQRSLIYIRDLRYMRYMQALGDIQVQYEDYVRIQYLKILRSIGQLKNVQHEQYLQNVVSLWELQDLLYPRYLLNFLLTEETTQKAIDRLTSFDVAERLDPLNILLGRVLQIQEDFQIGEVYEQELQKIMHVAHTGFASAENDEVREVMLEILRYLPARSKHEISMIVQLAEETKEERIKQACAVAIEYARPMTRDALTELRASMSSTVKVIGIAANNRLKREHNIHRYRRLGWKRGRVIKTAFLMRRRRKRWQHLPFF